MLLARMTTVDDDEPRFMFSHHGSRAGACYGGALDGLAQFDQIFRSGHRHEQVPAGRDDPLAFSRIASRMEGHDQRHAAVDQWQPAVGVGGDPRHRRIAPGGDIHRRRGEIDPDGRDFTVLAQQAERVTESAAKVGDGAPGRR